MTASRVTPPVQRRRLVRARDLATFRRALVERALAGDPFDARRRALILPTQASIEVFRQAIESAAAASGSSAIVLPELLTRDEWISQFHQALDGAPRLLSPIEREVLFERAARAAGTRGWLPGPPFEIRPGLVAEMLNFYDELRRRQRTIGRFSRALFEQLRVERGTDRGSESLIHQTSFLGFTFLGYERGVAASGALDEHTLRARLLDPTFSSPFDHVVVAVADHPSDPRGLWPADFDLLGRLRTVSRLDIVLTDETHDAGFRERLEQELPGIEEERADRHAVLAGEGPEAPTLMGPAGSDAETLGFIHRDREEELRDVVRSIRAQAAETAFELREPTAIVFQRPLPYLYLARKVLADGHVPFQAFDALPLAAEPYAAVLDLVLAFARTGGTREAAVALLRTPLLRFEIDGTAIAPEDAGALDVALTERRALGEADTYPDEITRFFAGRPSRDGIVAARAQRGARAAAGIRVALLPYREAATASARVMAISTFLCTHEQPLEESGSAPASAPSGSAPAAGAVVGPRANESMPRGAINIADTNDRHHRGRAAVLAVLQDLATALRLHDDEARPPEVLTAAIRHGIEGRTFAPTRGAAGVHLVDAVAARFGEFDHVHLVGLVETDWPERLRRSIFFTSGLLKLLGWPQEPDQTRAQQAAFRDLVHLPSRTLSLHGFQLEGDRIVALSPMMEAARHLPRRETAAMPARLTFPDEVLAATALSAAGLCPETGAWLQLRAARPPLTARQYSGFVDAQPAVPYRVSRVDRYIDCPFKYFSESVLGLPEEREETSGLTPLERGTLVHQLFEDFYRQWSRAGRGTITPGTLPEALELFGRLTREALEDYAEADRALENTRLLGSIVARGVAERVFELESNAGGTIADRLVEFKLNGPFTFPRLGGLKPRVIEIRGKADRIDVFDDGSLRVVDYKLSRVPDTDVSIQIAVYARAVQQSLEARDGRPHPVAEAIYVAFSDERRTEGRLGSKAEPVELALEARAADFVAAVVQIESGEFPPRPKRPGDCQWCRYAGVCRKEYLIEDDAAESV